jgi:hypothetical protein
MGVQAVEWRIRNDGLNKFEVKFTKVYNGHIRRKGSVVIEPNKTFIGGRWVGDDLTLWDDLFTPDDMPNGSSITSVSIENVVIIDQDKRDNLMMKRRSERTLLSLKKDWDDYMKQKQKELADYVKQAEREKEVRKKKEEEYRQKLIEEKKRLEAEKKLREEERIQKENERRLQEEQKDIERNQKSESKKKTNITKSKDNVCVKVWWNYQDDSKNKTELESKANNVIDLLKNNGYNVYSGGGLYYMSIDLNHFDSEKGYIKYNNNSSSTLNFVKEITEIISTAVSLKDEGLEYPIQSECSNMILIEIGITDRISKRQK